MAIFNKSKQRTGPSTNQKYPEGRALGSFDIKCPAIQKGKAVQTKEGGVANPGKPMDYK